MGRLIFVNKIWKFNFCNDNFTFMKTYYQMHCWAIPNPHQHVSKKSRVEGGGGKKRQLVMKRVGVIPVVTFLTPLA